MQVTCAALRSEDMKKGYASELQARRTEMEIMKLEFEGLYMRVEEESVIENSNELKALYDQAFSKVEAYVTSLAGTIKSVRLAVDPCFNQY